MDTLWFRSHIQSPQAFGKIRNDNCEYICVRIPEAQGETAAYPLPCRDKRFISTMLWSKHVGRKVGEIP